MIYVQNHYVLPYLPLYPVPDLNSCGYDTNGVCGIINCVSVTFTDEITIICIELFNNKFYFKIYEI